MCRYQGSLLVRGIVRVQTKLCGPLASQASAEAPTVKQPSKESECRARCVLSIKNSFLRSMWALNIQRYGHYTINHYLKETLTVKDRRNEKNDHVPYAPTELRAPVCGKNLEALRTLNSKNLP